jgi:hypothetical protein
LARGGSPSRAAAAARPPEDVHTYVEREVERRVGAELAGRLRTGRSRNDLVATDLRLYCREEGAGLRRDLAACVGGLADLAGRAGALIVPGYTHLRRAQPILLAHQVLAHAAWLMRDDARVAEALVADGVCPLGSGALAGTTVPVDRQALARRLGFARASANSLDAVSDRDFVADLLYASSLAMIHLSQIAEDLILATAEEFGWMALEDAAATGSSLMPQKKNPDALELLRGKGPRRRPAGRLTARAAGVLQPGPSGRQEALFDRLGSAAPLKRQRSASTATAAGTRAGGRRRRHAGDRSGRLPRRPWAAVRRGARLRRPGGRPGAPDGNAAGAPVPRDAAGHQSARRSRRFRAARRPRLGGAPRLRRRHRSGAGRRGAARAWAWAAGAPGGPRSLSPFPAPLRPASEATCRSSRLDPLWAHGILLRSMARRCG